MKCLSNCSKILLIISFVFLSGCVMNPDEKSSSKHSGDNLIISLINFDYAKDSLLNPFKIKVSSKNGNVKLKGDVKTKTEYIHAIKIAQSKDGVRNVDASELNILDSVQPITDATITGKVYGHLMRTKIFSSKKVELWPVKVETKNGMVYLSGRVENNKVKDTIIRSVEEIVGKNSVNASLLKVKY